MSYEELVQLFWQQIDPTDPGGQFHDRGESYQTAIFYHHEEQKEIAERSKRELGESGRFNSPLRQVLDLQSPFILRKKDIKIIIKNRSHIIVYIKKVLGEMILLKRIGMKKKNRLT